MKQHSSAMTVIDGVAVPARFPTAPVLIGSEVYRHSIYGRRHPLSIARVSATLDLIAALGWHDPAGYIDSPQASAEALARFHCPEYIAAIMDAEATGQVAPAVRDRFNIGRNGNPVFPEIFRRPATAAGASILAARMLAGVAGGTVYSPAGGTHHGRADQASGFCYFNDPVLAILTLRDAGIAPILYVDLDAHHGDGVEAAFANDDQVLTVSIHEEGRWPGTGKRGERAGGAARNLPVPAQFNDSELAFLIAEAVLPLARRWRPAALSCKPGSTPWPMTRKANWRCPMARSGRRCALFCRWRRGVWWWAAVATTPGRWPAPGPGFGDASPVTRRRAALCRRRPRRFCAV